MHLTFKAFKWGINESFWSNMTPRNLASLTTLIFLPFNNINSGSGKMPLFLWKWRQTVLVGENLNPFSLHHFSILWRHPWSWRSHDFVFLARYDIKKSLTYKEPSTSLFKTLTRLLIFKLKRVTDSILPCDTPISCSYVSESIDPRRTLKISIF